MTDAVSAARTSGVFAGAAVVAAVVGGVATAAVGTNSFGAGLLTGVASTAVFATILVSAGRAER
jgi:hypothetical protein